LAFLF